MTSVDVEFMTIPGYRLVTVFSRVEQILHGGVEFFS